MEAHQRNQIDTAFIFARTDLVNVHHSTNFLSVETLQSFAVTLLAKTPGGSPSGNQPKL